VKKVEQNLIPLRPVKVPKISFQHGEKYFLIPEKELKRQDVELGRIKNVNLQPLPAIQTTIEFHIIPFYFLNAFAKTSSPTLIVFDVFI
jgi:hypothetical protein